MTPEEIAKLKETYTGRTVVVEVLRPELTRWANVPGKVITINGNGRALVQFEGPDTGWYDIDPDYLRFYEPPMEQITEAEKIKQ